jgi:hypothetical protein
VAFAARAGVTASFGSAPRPVGGGTVGVEAHAGRWSLGLEGTVDATASAPATGGGRVSSSLVAGALSFCAEARPVFACAIGEVGWIRASSEGIVDARQASLLWLAAGARFGVEIPIEGQVAFRLRSDVVVDVGPPRLEVNGTRAWSAPLFATALAGDVVVHF